MPESEARTQAQSQPLSEGTLGDGSDFVIRRYTPADRESVLRLRGRHDESLWFADPDDPIHFVTFLLEVDGKPVASITGRATIEGFLMIDRSFGTPAARLDAIHALVDVGAAHAASLGVREIHMATDPKWRGWIRKLLRLRGAFNDNRHHVILSTVARGGN